MFKGIIGKFKNKKNNYPLDFEYVFSDEEIHEIENENKEKLLALKNSKVNKREKIVERDVDELIVDNMGTNVKPKKRDILDSVDYDKDKITYTKIVKKLNGELKEDEVNEENKVIDEKKEKYVELSDDLQQKINEAIEKVDLIVLDNYIIKGKDLIQHNYIITYGEEALRFVYQVRHEFEVLIEYLIGFNNEKKGIYDKTTFSDNLDDEWHYLKNYIKILEQIRSIKER